ncbi:MAG: phosphodiesterase [Gammaproteobacteria bacterium]|nr:phosphodiesterase [Gammaproteobacteria bacterium]MBU0787032.1 phosphodiesterase [Gammaproteobacteria bacterium]MBU0816283.1 phosphodiesterase [Gammaproteobacteria bacterium]MBU1787920.1 phosphodiesterase [Gammaproteobacteria bacterium]
MELIELNSEELSLGMALKYTLRDETGAVLLAKGNRIETDRQLASIKSRKKILVEFDETVAGTRALMSGISALTRAGAPIKDISKFVSSQPALSEDKLVGTLVERWGDMESKLRGLLGSVDTTPDFDKKIRTLTRHIDTLMMENSSSSIFLLFNRAVTHFEGYSVTHALLCATLAHTMSEVFVMTEDERQSLVCAALTMNVAMTRLQDVLAAQKDVPNVHQRKEIDDHPLNGMKILMGAGVKDKIWLEIVARHHEALKGPDLLADWPPVLRLTKILQTLDRYTAALSPRKSREGRTARDSTRSVVVQPGANKQDEVGSALFRNLGMCPPGTYVKLNNGETAVVIRRGSKPMEPVVASVLNRNDEPIAEPRARDTAIPTHAIQSVLTATAIKVNLRLEAMCRLIAA